MNAMLPLAEKKNGKDLAKKSECVSAGLDQNVFRRAATWERSEGECYNSMSTAPVQHIHGPRGVKYFRGCRADWRPWAGRNSVISINCCQNFRAPQITPLAQYEGHFFVKNPE